MFPAQHGRTMVTVVYDPWGPDGPQRARSEYWKVRISVISAGPSEQTHTGVGWGSAGHSRADEAGAPGARSWGDRQESGRAGWGPPGPLQMEAVAWAVWGLAMVIQRPGGQPGHSRPRLPLSPAHVSISTSESMTPSSGLFLGQENPVPSLPGLPPLHSGPPRAGRRSRALLLSGTVCDGGNALCLFCPTEQ